MPIRGMALLLAAIGAAALMAALVGYSQAAAIPEDTLQFQDGAGNEKLTFVPGEAAEIYVRDIGLATTSTSSAVWNGLGFRVDANTTWWSLATGAPEPSVYQLALGSLFSTSSPSQTPLSGPPPYAEVNGVPTLVSNLRVDLGEFTLLNDVDAGSDLAVWFAFDVVDSYAPVTERVRVTSTSDTDGEWLAITEVVSETDAAAGATSGLFRGSVALSAASSSLAAGDGEVWVQEGDTLRAAYYDSDGSGPVSTHTARILEAPPVPAAGWHTTIALAFALAAAFLLNARSRRSLRRPST